MAINEVINEYVRQSGVMTITLIGYSGGGVIAALIAARRDDVDKLITVASNLDHAAWVSMHEVSPLIGSLNPVDYSAELRQVKQIHFVGEDDDVVTDAITRSYLEKLGTGHETDLQEIPGFDHECCWVDAWPELRQKALSGSE